MGSTNAPTLTVINSWSACSAKGWAMFEEFERRQIEIGKCIIINCMIAGSGPPVLLLHGFPQNLAM